MRTIAKFLTFTGILFFLITGKVVIAQCGVCKHYVWVHPCGIYSFGTYGNANIPPGQATGNCNSLGQSGGSVITPTVLPITIVNGDTLPKPGITKETITVEPSMSYASCNAAVISQVGNNLVFDFYVWLPPTVSISGATTICAGSGNVTLTASGGGSYTWAPGGATTTAITVSPTSTTTYTVTANNGGGCSASATAVVKVTTCGFNITSTNISMCRKECRTITATGSGGTAGYTYVWKPGGATGSNISVCPLVSTTYTVTATDGAGATATAIAAVTIIPTPTANFSLSPSGSVLPNTPVSFTDLSTGGGTLLWNFGDPLSGIDNTSALTSPTHTYSNTGDYCVFLTSTSSNSCVDTISKCIEVIGDPLIVIPNIFTPNGDGVNDLFYFYTEGVKELSCTIYDRWGIKVSEWNTILGGWDGRLSSGSIASDGVYYFVMTATPANERKEVIKQQGFLQLLKEK